MLRARLPDLTSWMLDLKRVILALGMLLLVGAPAAPATLPPPARTTGC